MSDSVGLQQPNGGDSPRKTWARRGVIALLAALLVIGVAGIYTVENPFDESPTETPTESPTETPTESPTETPTESPTETPTASPTGGLPDNCDVGVSEGSIDYAGAGTVESPYQIETLAHLQGMNSCEATLDAHYELVNDIDATPTKAWNDGKGFNPIGYRIITAVGEPEPAGSDNRTFSGSLDGNGHSISGLHINREKNNYTGMIVYAEDTALVENLRLDNITVEGDSNTGGLLAENFGTVRNVTVVGEVDGGGTTGGLVGTNKGPVSNSSADVDVTLVGKYADEGPESGNVAGDGYWMAGGLIGYNEAIVSNSSASGDVSGLQEAGGLIGDNNFGSTVSNSSASGDVTGSGSTGGLAGENDGLIEYSTASGTVSGGVDAGGLVGANLYGTVAHSRASGDVGGKETYPVGTLIGTNQQNVVVNSTATGESIGEQILPVIGSNLCDTSPCD